MVLDQIITLCILYSILHPTSQNIEKNRNLQLHIYQKRKG